MLESSNGITLHCLLLQAFIQRQAVGPESAPLNHSQKALPMVNAVLQVKLEQNFLSFLERILNFFITQDIPTDSHYGCEHWTALVTALQLQYACGTTLNNGLAQALLLDTVHVTTDTANMPPSLSTPHPNLTGCVRRHGHMQACLARSIQIRSGLRGAAGPAAWAIKVCSQFRRTHDHLAASCPQLDKALETMCSSWSIRASSQRSSMCRGRCLHKMLCQLP